MSQHHVLLISQDNAFYHDLITKSGLPALQCTRSDHLPTSQEDLSDFDIVLGEPARIAPFLSKLSALKWVQSTYAGVDALIASGLRQDYQLTNARGIFDSLMCEYVFAHILNLTRHLSIYQNQQKKRTWQRHAYLSIAEQSMLILGTGHIGCALAKAAKAFHMHVEGINSTGRDVAGFDAVYKIDALIQRMKNTDVLVNTLPSTPATRGLLTADTFSDAKAHSLFINIGRGDIISTQDLASILTGQKIKHAVIDVFEQEPLSETSTLWALPNLTITPHNAAYSFPSSVMTLFTQNYLRFVDGKPLQGVVDFQKGY